jgi:hypothetical protein
MIGEMLDHKITVKGSDIAAVGETAESSLKIAAKLTRPSAILGASSGG